MSGQGPSGPAGPGEADEFPSALTRRAATAVKAVIADAATAQRDDLAQRLDAEARRWGSPEATVVVAGEQNRGKTSLINAMLGRPLLPTGATQTTGTFAIVRSGKEPRALVHRVGAPAEEIALDDLAIPMSAAPSEGIEGIIVDLDHPLLEDGFVLVDTPGVGGLDATLARVTLTALSRADALVMVLDPDEPLSSSELSFIQRAADRIERVVFVLARVDRTGAWRRIAEDNRALLARHAPRFADAPLLPVSAKLKLLSDELEAAGTPDHSLAGESGVPALTETIRRTVVGRVRALRIANLLRLSISTIAVLEQPWRVTLNASDSHAAAEAEAERAQRELDDLRDVGERLSVDVADRFAALRDIAQAGFARVIRDLTARFGGDTVTVSDHLLDELRDGLRAGCAELDEALVARVEAIIDDARAALSSVGLDLPTLLPAELLSLNLDDLGDAVDAAVADPGTRIRLASSVSSGGAALVAFGARLGADPILMGVMGATTLLALARAALGARLAQRQRDAAVVRRQVREALEAARMEASPAMRQQILASQRELERTIRSMVRTRTSELHESIAQSTRLARADARERQQRRDEAQRALAALEARRAEIVGVASELAPSLLPLDAPTPEVLPAGGGDGHS